MTETFKYSPTPEAGQQVLPITRAVELVDRVWDAQREKLSLQRAPIEIRISKRQEQTTEYHATVRSYLRRNDFYDFLTLVAPNKRSFDMRGVLDDWDMPDESYSYSQDRRQRHEALGEAWDIFEKSRKIFIQGLTFNSQILFELAKNYWTEEMTESRLRRFLIYPHPQRDTRLYSLFRLEHYQKFLNPIQERKMGRKKEMRDIRENLVRYSSLKGKKREEMVDEYLDSLTDEERISMLAAYARADSRSLLKKDTPVKYGPFEIKEENGQVGIRSGDFKASAVINQALRNNGLLSIDEVSIDNGCSITPVLHWIKYQDGHREYIFDFPTDEEGKQIKTKNPLVGLLSIAYFCPDIVDGVNGVGGWPKYVGLPDKKGAQIETAMELPKGKAVPDKKRKQFMGPAQVPVLAIMFKRSLLNSDFINAVEDFARQNSR